MGCPREGEARSAGSSDLLDRADLAIHSCAFSCGICETLAFPKPCSVPIEIIL